MRQPGVAGFFYPKEPDVLNATLDQFFLAPSLVDTSQIIRGIIAPHAGYMYSGQTAALAYQTLRPFKYDSIILLGPTHRMPLPLGSVLQENAYLTPLGAIQIDQSLANAIVLACPELGYIPDAFNQEHSLEVHLPFIQKTFQVVPPIVPILVGAHSYESIQKIAQAILNSIPQNQTCLVIASSDLSHFYSADVAEKIDRFSLAVIEENSIEKLGSELAAGKAEMCGFGPILTLMMMMEAWGTFHSQVLGYTHSGNVTGDQSRVVGYGSVVYY